MKNHFKTFALEENFTIDLDDLEKKYLQFQRQFHPDKSSSDDISKSIEINEAYNILSDNFLRACHLLQLKNIDILNDEKAVKVDISTLEKVLELQEKIAIMNNKSEIEDLYKNINLQFHNLILQAIECFEDAKINDAAQILIKAKYLKKSLQDLKIRKNKV